MEDKAVSEEPGNDSKVTEINKEELTSIFCTNKNNVDTTKNIENAMYKDNNISEEGVSTYSNNDDEANSKPNLPNIEYEEIKVENFDAFEDENNKIYRNYNLRRDRKSKTLNLNEEKLFQESQKLYKHTNQKIKTKSSNGQIKCFLCPETFETKYLLSCHNRKMHNFKNVYTCFYCQKDFEKNTDLVKHKTTHEEEKQCFTCATCKMAFSTELTYFRHTYNHSKPPYKCKECLFTTEDINSIKSHIIMHCDSKQTCKICNKMIASRSIAQHIRMHSINIECGECGKTLKTNKDYDYHMISHTGVKKEQCLYCGKAFASVGQLEVHTRIHTGERSFECKICHMKFVQGVDHKRHLAVHSDKRFECDYCGKKFLHKESIIFHIRLHTNYKPYKCPECHKCFTTGSHLTTHTYREHMDHRFTCDTCDLKFFLKRDYNRHILCKSHKKKALRHLKSEEKIKL